jgi:recombinational DNA repair ATPase RecF
MELTLLNYRCFSKAEFTIPLDTNTLISAASGSGKTTILEAIRFALWGLRDTDIITVGKKKCLVTMEYKGSLFMRGKNPSVTTTTTDSTKCFTQYPSNFFYKSPVLQYTELEKLANIHGMGSIEDSIKELLADGSKEILKSRTTISVFEKTIRNIMNGDDNDDDDGEYNDSSDNSGIMKYTDENIEVVKDLYLTALKEKERVVSVQNTLKALEAEKENLYVIDSDTSDIIKYFYDSLSLKKQLRGLYSKRPYAPYDPAYHARLKRMLPIAIKFKAAKEFCDKHFHADNIFLRTNNIQSVLDDLNKLLTRPSCSAREIICPYCTNTVSLNKKGEPIIPFHKQKEAVILKGYIEELVPYQSDLDDQIEIKLEILEKDRINEEFIKSETIALNAKLDSIPVVTKTQVDEYKRNQKARDQLVYIESKIDENKQQLSALRTQSTIQEDIDIFEKIIKTHNQRKATETIKKQLEKLNEDLKIERKKLVRMETMHYNISLLRSALVQSKKEAMDSVLDTFNKELDVICSNFFIEDIKVVCSVADNLKLKTDIVYNGINMKPSLMSSGEFSRLSLAADLALYRMIGTRAPLLLDEIDKHLDLATATTVLEYIVHNFDNVLVVAHHMITGLFDNVLTGEWIADRSKKI